MGFYQLKFMADKHEETISCPIGKWYFKRMSLLGLLLIGFGGWFLYDAVIGYPKGAVKAVINEGFRAGSSTSWEAYATDPKNNFAKVELDPEQLEAVRSAHVEGEEVHVGGLCAEEKTRSRRPSSGFGEPGSVRSIHCRWWRRRGLEDLCCFKWSA